MACQSLVISIGRDLASWSSGTGITRVLSYQVADAIAAGKLLLVLQPFEPEPLPVHLVYPAPSLLTLKLRAFLDFAAPRLKAALVS